MSIFSDIIDLAKRKAKGQRDKFNKRIEELKDPKKLVQGQKDEFNRRVGRQ